MNADERGFKARQAKRFPHHDCELPPHPNRVYPLLPPNASIWQKMKRFLQVVLVGWKACPQLRLLRPSTYSLEAEQARQARCVHWWILHPYSRACLLWQLFMIIVLSLNLSVHAFHYAVVDHLRPFAGINASGDLPYVPWLDPKNEDAKRYMADTTIVYKMTRPCLSSLDTIFYIHMGLKFITGYYDEQRDAVILHPFSIMKRYVSSWFVFDFLSSIRYRLARKEIILSGQDQDNLYFYLENRLAIIGVEFLRCLKLFRAIDLFTYIKNWCKMASIKQVKINLILFAVAYILFIQWAVYFSAKIPLLAQGVFLYRSDSQSWVSDPALGYLELSYRKAWIRQYILSLHRVVTSAGRYVPITSLGKSTPEDRVVSLLIMWIGTIFNVVLFAFVLQYVEDVRVQEVDQERVMGQVRTYMRCKNLPMHLRHRILLYYDLKYKDRFYNERAILAHMPTRLRNSVRQGSCRRLVSESVLFRGIPKAMVNQIVKQLDEDLYLPNDVVYCCEEAARHLYLLSTGSVAVFTRTGEEVGHLEGGTCFGEMGLVLPQHKHRRVETVVAVEVCEIFLLKEKDFEVVKHMPRIYNRIRAIALGREREILEYEEYFSAPGSIGDDSD